MASQKLPESEAASAPSSMSEDADNWIRRFTAFVEENFIDASCRLSRDASLADYQYATIRAVWQTLLESGMDPESIMVTIGQVLIETVAPLGEWNSELNRRRFELIDKEIQHSLTPAERIELAGLTRLMRNQLESEANLPLEGARELHRKLLDIDARQKPR
jgi:hypothetical protein